MDKNFPFGNYPTYYGYRNSSKVRVDPRVTVFDSQWFQHKIILDIGCNAGALTIDIAKRFNPKMIVGVDIDDTLVKKAQRHSRFNYSLIKPVSVEEAKNSAISDDDFFNYFPISCPIKAGSLPMIKPTFYSSGNENSFRFPLNVKFKCMDWTIRCDFMVTHFISNHISLSVTKWIHLNWGDHGIKKLFSKVYDSLISGGLFILEPQLWKTYSTRLKHSPKAKEMYGNIQLFPDMFKDYLVGLGFEVYQEITETQALTQGFKRPITGQNKKLCSGVPVERMERTYIMVKPDGVQRGLVGEIIKRFEQKGYQLLAAKLTKASQTLLENHYRDLSGKGFFAGLIKYMASGPVMCLVFSGKGVVKTGRKLLGETNPLESLPGTIRGDFCIEVGRNICHGSDSVESAEREIALWFPEGVQQYTRAVDQWIYE